MTPSNGLLANFWKTTIYLSVVPKFYYSKLLRSVVGSTGETDAAEKTILVLSVMARNESSYSMNRFSFTNVHSDAINENKNAAKSKYVMDSVLVFTASKQFCNSSMLSIVKIWD